MMKPMPKIEEDGAYITFEQLLTAEQIKKNSWIYCQYISFNDMGDKDYFSGYIITNTGDFIPPPVNPKMWIKKEGNYDFVNREIVNFDSVIIYRSLDGNIFTMWGQTLSQ